MKQINKNKNKISHSFILVYRKSKKKKKVYISSTFFFYKQTNKTIRRKL